MNNKIIKNLVYVLGGLIIVVFLTTFFDNDNERNFKEKLIEIDTSAVTHISIKTNTNEKTDLVKNSKDWFVKISENRNAIVPKSKIKALLTRLDAIKIKRLVGNNQSKWQEFQVDTSATNVQVFDGNSKLADFYIGKFDVAGQREFYTFVRNKDEEQTYSVEGFLTSEFGRGPNSFRDNLLMNTKSSDWKELQFEDEDESFTMNKINKNWFIGNTKLDSTEVVKYLKSIENLHSNDFVDEVEESSVQVVKNRLRIISENQKPIEIKSFESNQKEVIFSSENPESYFDANKSKLKEKIFIKKEKLLSSK